MDSSSNCERSGIKVPCSRCNPCSKEEPIENRTVVAVDVAKNVFEIAVSEIPGQVVRRERLPRSTFLEFFTQIPLAMVVMEACGSATHWGRQIERLGHGVTLLPAHHVRPYITRNKTDRTDAKGILEAYRNKDLRPVPMKTIDQQVVAALCSTPLARMLATR